MCYSTQIKYLNSNMDFLEAQFKGMTFPGRVSPHLGRTTGRCLWHPIKFAKVSHPSAYEGMEKLHSCQFSNKLNLEPLISVLHVLAYWLLHQPQEDFLYPFIRWGTWSTECFLASLVKEADHNSGLLAQEEEIWKWQVELPFNECSPCARHWVRCSAHVISFNI